MTDAWNQTVAPSWREVPVTVDRTIDPRSTSGLGMCDESPDTRHWWDLSAVCSQSNEQMTCRWCGTVIYD